MLFTHMDQLGFVVRKIEADGLIRVERLGGVPERALPSQAVLLCVGEGQDVPGVIANKSHHATTPEEKYKVAALRRSSTSTPASAVAAAVRGGRHRYRHADRLSRRRWWSWPATGSPAPRSTTAPAAPCMLEVARALHGRGRAADGASRLLGAGGVQPARRGDGGAGAEARHRDPARPDARHRHARHGATRGEVTLGGGPAHEPLFASTAAARSTARIPHPALVRLFEETAAAERLPLQRSAHIGALTDPSYVQLVGEGVAAIDLGFPMPLHAFVARSLRPRRSRGADAAAGRGARRGSTPEFSLDRDDYVDMKHYLGIDIGTFESKGVLVDAARAGSSPGRRARTRCSCRSPAGPSTGRARTGGAISPSSPAKLLADSGVDPPVDIRAVGGERHRPLHAAGRCGRRAADERRALRRRHARGSGDRGADAADRRGRAPRRAAAMR